MLLSAVRTPIGTFGGAFKDVEAADLGAVGVREALRRAGVAGGDLDDVIMGCVLQAGAGMNVARQAAVRGRRAGDGAGRDGEPRVRVRAAGRGARRGGDPRRLRARSCWPAAPSR